MVIYRKLRQNVMQELYFVIRMFVIGYISVHLDYKCKYLMQMFCMMTNKLDIYNHFYVVPKKQ